MPNREEIRLLSQSFGRLSFIAAHSVFRCHLVLLCSGVHIEVATQTQPQDHTAASSDLHRQCILIHIVSMVCIVGMYQVYDYNCAPAAGGWGEGMGKVAAYSNTLEEEDEIG
jgi:hypothetical protein